MDSNDSYLVTNSIPGTFKYGNSYKLVSHTKIFLPPPQKTCLFPPTRFSSKPKAQGQNEAEGGHGSSV